MLDFIAKGGLFILNGTMELVLPSTIREATPVMAVSSQPCRYSVGEGSEAYVSQDGFLLSSDGSVLVAGNSGSAVPESVDVVAPLAMIGQASGGLELKGVDSVGGYAFAFSDSLTSVVLDDVATIGKGAFLACTGLESLAAGEGRMEIGDYSFMAAHALSEITLPASLERLGTGAFAGWAMLGDSSDPDGVTSYKARNVRFTGPSMLSQFGSKPFEMTPVVSISLSSDFLAQYWQAIFRGLEKPDEVGHDGLSISFDEGVRTISRLPLESEHLEVPRVNCENNFETLRLVHIGPSSSRSLL